MSASTPCPQSAEASEYAARKSVSELPAPESRGSAGAWAQPAAAHARRKTERSGERIPFHYTSGPGPASCAARTKMRTASLEDGVWRPGPASCTLSRMRVLIEATRAEYERYKALGEGALGRIEGAGWRYLGIPPGHSAAR